MAKTALVKGSTLDGFTIGEIVHRGGMAIFYAVTHPDHAMPLLMKVPYLREGEDPAAIVGFEMEQMVLPRLSGPHVPRFIAAGDFASQPYLVYERIQGRTLYARMKELPLPPEEVASLAAKAATALHDVHNQHVIHLDVKPSNIIIRDSDGEAVLIDYGLSHHTELPDLMFEEFRLPYGTAPYMAPEQVFGIRNDLRSDIFALGVLMYFFATGKRPFGDPQRLRGLKRRLWWDPPPPRRVNPAVPPWLQEVILRCLAPDPAARYPTAAQLAFDLSNHDQITLTARSEKLARDPWSTRLKRRMHPDSYRPDATRRRPEAGTGLVGAPIVVAAIDLSESHKALRETIRQTVGRILATLPDARLACLNVQRLNLLTPDDALDAEGHSIHVRRIAELRDWARSLGIPPERVTCHVLEAVDAGAAILDYVRTNHVDHVVLGAATGARLRNVLGSVAIDIVQKAPCTVTVVRKPRAEAASEEMSATTTATTATAPSPVAAQ